MYSSNSAPPPRPSPFIWTCHVCNLTLPLAATTRCLSCSHSFCAGRPSNSILPPRQSKKTRRSHITKACGSTFDYQGWQAWGEWRRQRDDPVSDDSAEEQDSKDIEQECKGVRTENRNCEKNCDFPSQCRWAPRLSAASASALAPASIQTSNAQLRYRNLLLSHQLERSELRAIKETLIFSGGGGGSAAAGVKIETKTKTLSSIDEREKSEAYKQDLTFPSLDFSAFKAQDDRRMKPVEAGFRDQQIKVRSGRDIQGNDVTQVEMKDVEIY